MADRTGTPAGDEGPGAGTRRRWVPVAALAVMTVAAVAVVLAVRSGDGDGDGDDDVAAPATTSATVASTTAPTAPDRGEGAGTTTGSGSADGSADGANGDGTAGGGSGDAATPTSLPQGAIAGDTEAERCADAQESLAPYAALARSDDPPSQYAVDALEELGSSIAVAADMQDWGDRMVEPLTNVRREWVTARSAQANGDAAQVRTHVVAARRFMDQALAVDCPT